ncbi:MAG: nitrogen fixation protein NifQ [Candidatus Sedimenticola endophacoides]
MNLPAMKAMHTVEDVYARLMASRRGEPVEDTLARILSSWMCGEGAMPRWLGMSQEQFIRMMEHHFPSADACMFDALGRELPDVRLDEMEDLHKLLIQGRTGNSDSERWMADILIGGCLGDDHLWQDLGLWSRADLSRLMSENFGPLAARNDKNMKWKKFLYKELCETEGIYTCRAPSCEVCADYQNCFGPED